MSDIVHISEIPQLLAQRTPLLDVRAPVEFARGAVPTATNLPLLTDGEREAVGIRYRQSGKDAAVALGESLVSGEVRDRRVQQWCGFMAANPGAVLYCFRGGLRSAIVQQWLGEAGVGVPRIEGGYKALRRYLLGMLESLCDGDNLMVIGGKTGSGKTHLLNLLPNSLDLEGFARHRGSAFGRRAEVQPSQTDFENGLAMRLLDLDWSGCQRVAIEDESRSIGSVSLPPPLYQRMQQSAIAMLDESLGRRVDTIHLDYIQSNYQDFLALDADGAEQRFSDSLLLALKKIRRRLGEDAYWAVHKLMELALKEQRADGSIESHKLWIAELLQRYYDPMYEYQMKNKVKRVVVRGSREELAAWLPARLVIQEPELEH